MTAPTLEQVPVRVDFGDRGGRRRRLVRALLVVLALLAVAAGVWLVWFSSVLSVKTVRVVGVDGDSARAVLQAAAVPVGVPLARVDTGGAEARVVSLAWVSGVEVRRGWPAEVVIAIVPRTPIAALAGAGTRRVVDGTGAVFDAAAGMARELPGVEAEGVALEEAMAVLSSLPVDLARRVASLSATTRDDVDFRLRSGATVRWGSAEQPEAKAVVLRALLRRSADVYDVSAPELPTTFRAR